MSVIKPITDAELARYDAALDKYLIAELHVDGDFTAAIRERLRHVEQVLKYEKLENDELRESERLADEALEVAIDLWARETTGLGSKIDRFVRLKRFESLVKDYRAMREEINDIPTAE